MGNLFTSVTDVSWTRVLNSLFHWFSSTYVLCQAPIAKDTLMLFCPFQLYYGWITKLMQQVHSPEPIFDDRKLFWLAESNGVLTPGKSLIVKSVKCNNSNMKQPCKNMGFSVINLTINFHCEKAACQTQFTPYTPLCYFWTMKHKISLETIVTKSYRLENVGVKKLPFDWLSLQRKSHK